MSYQIPSKVKALFLLNETEENLYKIRPQRDLVLKHAQVTLYIKGHVGSDFKMRLNVYRDEEGSQILISSTAVNNLDISRTGDTYAEIRFDFPLSGNLMGIQKLHLVTFEIYDGYTYDSNNFVSIILNPQATQGYLGSDYYEVADAPKLGAQMSFFWDTPNTSTEKYFLCRVNGGKLLNGLADLIDEEIQFFPARHFYTCTIQKGLVIDSFNVTYTNFGSNDVTPVYDNEETFTPDPMSVDTNLNKYFYDPSTGELRFYIDSSLNDTNFAILEYLLFFTNHRGKYARSNPSGSGDVVYWEPRLSDDLSFDFSQSNNLQGILSISSSPISLKNQDGKMNQFFSVNDCFNNRDMKCWKVDNGVTTVAFTGVIRGASVDDDSCNLTIADPLAKLSQNLADTVNLKYSDFVFYTIRSDDAEKRVPVVLGKISSFSLLTKVTGQALNIPWMNPEMMIECTCVSYLPVPATNTNRTWSVGLGPSSAATQNRDVTAVSNYTSGTFLATRFEVDPALGPINEWLPAGTCIENNGIRGIVYASDATGCWVWPRNASYSAAFNIIRHKIISVVVQRGGTNFYPLAGRDWTAQIGLHGDIQIVFVNSFESTIALGSNFDPDSDRVFACVMNDSIDTRASQIVKSLLADVGLSVSSSFMPDQTPVAWSDPDVAITLPFPGSSDYPTYREIIELILKSAMACIYFDTNGDLRYKSFLQAIQEDSDDTENQSDFDVTNQITQKNSKDFSVSFDLWDLYTGAVFNFTHCRISNYGFEYAIAQHFYKTKNLYTVECILDPTRVSTGTYITEYSKLVVGRSASYSLTALSEHMGLWIGDDIQVKRKNLLGGSGQETLRVLGHKKTLTGHQINFTDLKKFPTI
jgi:hypothetical protein